jgi:hypothetical protein
MKRAEPEVDVASFENSKIPEFSLKSITSSTKPTYSNFISAGVEFESKKSNASTGLSLPSVNGERPISTIVDDDELIEDSVKSNKMENKFVKPETVCEKAKEEMFGFQSSFLVPNTKRPKVTVDDAEAKKVSLVSKCEEFLQSVKKNVGEKETRKRIPAKEEERKKITSDCDLGKA